MNDRRCAELGICTSAYHTSPSLPPDGTDTPVDTKRTIEIAASALKMLGLAALGVGMTALPAANAGRWLPGMRVGGLDQSLRTC